MAESKFKLYYLINYFYKSLKYALRGAVEIIVAPQSSQPKVRT